MYHDTIKIPAGIYPIEKTSFLIAVDTKISTNNILFLDKNFYSYDISKGLAGADCLCVFLEQKGDMYKVLTKNKFRRFHTIF